MKKWNEQELGIAFALYCQTPFGKIHSRNPVIQKIAEHMKRSASSLAMKMLNFASLDPEITNSGRKGLGNASNKDREIWEKFHQNWEDQAATSEEVIQQVFPESSDSIETYESENKQATVNVRIKQSFFRKSILANYNYMCCMSGLLDPRLLIASHIIPWSKSKQNRLNPKNGLCLSALHDKAFDKGLITVMPDYTICISESLRQSAVDQFSENVFLSLDGNKIKFPEKFVPDPELLDFHNRNIFLS